jgi:hypothetical protein
MGKFLDFIVKWTDIEYDANREALMAMFNVEDDNIDNTKTNVDAQSVNVNRPISKLNIQEAHNS